MWRIYFIDTCGHFHEEEAVATREEAEKRVEELNDDDMLDIEEYYEAWED